MKRKILFMGDDSLKGAAAYLGAVISHNRIPFTYVPSKEKAKLKGQEYSLYIISDYPAEKLSQDNQEIIVNHVKNGAGLLMIGGWESFYGAKGEYQNSPLEEILPVKCLDSDDRINYSQGLIPVVKSKHAILSGIPWKQPPVVCGFNRVKIKKEGRCILALKKLLLKNDSASIGATEYPLLVMGTYEKGKTCALTTDLAPHWCGGLVDWGKNRSKIKADKGEEVEVGNYYIKFISQLLNSF